MLVDLSKTYSPITRTWESGFPIFTARALMKGIPEWEYQPNRLVSRIDAAYEQLKTRKPLYIMVGKLYPNTWTALSYRIFQKYPTVLIAPAYGFQKQIRAFEDLDPLRTAIYDEYLGTCYAEDQAHMLLEASNILHMMGHGTFPKVQVMEDVIARDAERYGITVEYNLAQEAVKPTKAKPFYDSTSINVPALALCYALCLWHAANSDPDAPLIAEAPPELVVDRYYDDSYAYA